jgi:hypothetical protein
MTLSPLLKRQKKAADPVRVRGLRWKFLFRYFNSASNLPGSGRKTAPPHAQRAVARYDRSRVIQQHEIIFVATTRRVKSGSGRF